MIESLTALETIKTHSAESVVQSKWERPTAFLARRGVELRSPSSSANNGAAAVMQVANVLLIIAGVYLIQARELTMGGLIAVTMLGGRAMAPVAQAVASLMQYQNARLALTTLDQMMEHPVERTDATAFIHRRQLKGEIEFRYVSFAYAEQGENALKNSTLRVVHGERVLIVCRTGSGKTTLQKLMLGSYTPNDGVVRIDGIGLRQLDPADLRRNLGYVERDAMLFYGTLRENIAIGAPYADDAAIVAAAEVAGLTPFVNRHAKGFDMLIGERGESLSGGQRQEVAIARAAALLDPPILLLDEPTSAMDFSTEHGWKERLARFTAGKTLIIVTHRTSLIDLATRIIVLDDGQVVAARPREQGQNPRDAGRHARGRRPPARTGDRSAAIGPCWTGSAMNARVLGFARNMLSALTQRARLQPGFDRWMNRAAAVAPRHGRFRSVE